MTIEVPKIDADLGTARKRYIIKTHTVCHAHLDSKVKTQIKKLNNRATNLKVSLY